MLLASLALALAAVPASAKDKSKKDKSKSGAEAPYALIYGTIWSAEGMPIYGATIKIQRVGDKKPRWELISNHLGEFAQRVPAGAADYRVWAEIKGQHGKVQRPETQVHIENDERVDIGLHLSE